MPPWSTPPAPMMSCSRSATAWSCTTRRLADAGRAGDYGSGAADARKKPEATDSTDEHKDTRAESRRRTPTSLPGAGRDSTGIVTFLVGVLIAAYLFLTNPDPKSFEAYNFINTGLCLWVPLMTILFVLRQEPSQFGLARGDRKLGLKWALIAWAVMLLPVVYFAHRADVQELLPERTAALLDLTGFGNTTVFDGLHVNLKALLYYELAMGFYMFCWEFFFRGFLLFGLQKSPLGTWGAVIVQALLFMLLHWAWKTTITRLSRAGSAVGAAGRPDPGRPCHSHALVHLRLSGALGDFADSGPVLAGPVYISSFWVK